MPLRVFECACAVVVALTLALMARGRPGGTSRLLGDYGALAIAGYIGEETCVRVYGFYHYAPGWDLRVDAVPVLVPLIWPLVILSARSVAASLAPRASVVGRGLVVAGLVVADASLVEVVAVRAGLWSWAEEGYLGVPVIGILGWAFFAFAADVTRALVERAPRLVGLSAIVVAAPPVTHALIQIAWWGLFRWTVRGPVGELGTYVVVGLSMGATVLAVVGRARGLAMPLDVATPRMVAAALFVTELALVAKPWDGAIGRALWIHAAAIAVPYFAATRFSPGRRAEPRAR